MIKVLFSVISSLVTRVTSIPHESEDIVGDIMMARRVLYAGKVFQTQWKPLKEIEKVQLKRLKYIADHAYRNTLLYHRKFRESGIYPSDIHSFKDIKKIPPTTKDEMRRTEESAAKAYTPRNCLVFSTSGSTGKKLELYQDYSAFDFYMSVQLRYVFSIGMRPWHKYAFVSYDEGEKSGFSLAKLSYAVPVPWFLDEEKKVSLLRKIHPDVLGGHPCTLLLMAKRMQGDIPFSLKFVLLGGELSTVEERKYLEDVFGCETFDKYGSYELGQIACECPEHGMHIDADNNILEFLRDGEDAAPGESGEVVGTNLWNVAMPFIRYRIGDMAVPSDEICSCRRNFPLLSEIQGRKDDFIVRDGRFIPPTSIVPVFFTFKEIDAFQVIQENENRLRVRLVKGEGFTDETVNILTERLKSITGPMNICIEECDSIEEEMKLRAVISKVEKSRHCLENDHRRW